MEIKEKDIFFLINPNAGQSQARNKWEQVVEILKEKNLNYDHAFTESNAHAQFIVRDMVLRGFRRFVVVGGDGTLNEVVNGFYMQDMVSVKELYLGIILTGTGNDWAKYYGFNDNIEQSIDRIIFGRSKLQDLGRVSYLDENNERKTSYFINCAGLGMDSLIVKSTNSINKKGNRSNTLYLLSLLKSILRYKPWFLRICLNNLVFEGKFLSVSIGNGKYSGGGMMQTPDALNDDGLLDVSIYNDMSVFKVLRNITNLYNGKIYKVKGVNAFKTTNVRIESTHDTYLEIDGEIIGNGPYDIDVENLAINIFI